VYGTDFPNLPYAWDRELKNLVKARLPSDALRRILGSNAVTLFGLHGDTSSPTQNSRAGGG
jgi:uncharacterized protein